MKTAAKAFLLLTFPILAGILLVSDRVLQERRNRRIAALGRAEVEAGCD